MQGKLGAHGAHPAPTEAPQRLTFFQLGEARLNNGFAPSVLGPCQRVVHQLRHQFSDLFAFIALYLTASRRIGGLRA